MLFSSLTFLYYFLPAALIIYFAVPRRFKNLALLTESLIFYAWGEPMYVFLMIFTIALGYATGILMEKHRGENRARILLWLTVGIDLALLGLFKYADFFILNVNAATGLSLNLLSIALPVGISFYTFQIISYSVDVYRGTVSAQRSIVDLGAYVSMFPQLIAGPIVRYSHISLQLENRNHSFDAAADGVGRFVIGLAKKVLIANPLGEICTSFLVSGTQSLLFHWLYAIAFTLQIYYDFSGYSDMAIGLGRIMGFSLPENFNYPYISRSITDFWRRWHMSLGSWFRDYLYIPLGGNRVSRSRWFFNIFVVWACTGFWHGAAWNFMVWGLMFALLLAAEKLWLMKGLEKHKVLGHVYVMLFVILGFVVFNAESMGAALSHIGGMFAPRGALYDAESLYFLRSNALLLIFAVLGCTPLVKRLFSPLLQGRAGALLCPVGAMCLLMISTAFLVDGSFNPFLYFRF